ncbi:alpha/beta-hydrolase [Aulographum hederae CBS 113979]|uniref:Alpha/beta-hydrolase n=1 Tax=Aulographum hederae CBS 113979 TaxID=1176131 RepID=A0A6G1H003_9PEZI|nr:alpha/beta-hydrolase [Aulographum hederae CBS 113979]
MTLSMDPPKRQALRVTRRTKRSFYTLLLHAILKPFGAALAKSKHDHAPGSPQLTPPKSLYKRCEIAERYVENTYLYDISSKNTPQETKSRRRRIVYFAGGGWHMPPSPQHWKFCQYLAHHLPNTVITVVSYPLVPHNPAPITFPQLLALYRTISSIAQAEDENLILAGDSSGGNIVLAVALEALREPETHPPRSVFAICPSVDMARNNPDMREIEKHDPILNIGFTKDTADGWVGEWDLKDPRVSPLFANIASLSKAGVMVNGITGGYDVLRPDAILFRDKLEKEGVKGEWMDWDKQMHCFPLTFPYKLPESVECMRWIVDVIERDGEEPQVSDPGAVK